MKEAGHTEYDPDARVPLLVLASCPVADRPEDAPRLYGKLKINVSPDSMAFRIYRQAGVEEPFTCNYELNPAFRGKLETAGLTVSGVSEDGGARIIELPDHHFFLATGFVPQLASESAHPHPAIAAFLEAGAEYSRHGFTQPK